MGKKPTKEKLTGFRANYHLFIDIQTSKYFRQTGKEAYDSEEEASRIIGTILEAWNEKIAPEKLSLNNLNDSAKAGWFNSVELDFEKESKFLQSDDEYDEDFPDDMDESDFEDIEEPDEIFPFLPQGASMVLLFSAPAFEEYGYSEERFENIIRGEEPTETEINLIGWIYDFTLETVAAYYEKNSKVKDNLIAAAIEIATEHFDEETAVKVIDEIYLGIRTEFDQEKRNKKQQSKKKKSKKKK
jgi:hypothetical protein